MEKEKQHADRLKFNTFKKSGNFDIVTIARRESTDRIADEEFFLMMYMSTTVPFFFHYDKKSVYNLCRCMKVRTFAEKEVVYRQNDQANEMFVIYKGEVGLFAEDDLTTPKQKLGSNDVFGEKIIMG